MSITPYAFVNCTTVPVKSSFGFGLTMFVTVIVFVVILPSWVVTSTVYVPFAVTVKLSVAVAAPPQFIVSPFSTSLIVAIPVTASVAFTIISTSVISSPFFWIYR